MKTKGLDPKIARINNLAGAKAPFTARQNRLLKKSEETTKVAKRESAGVKTPSVCEPFLARLKAVPLLQSVPPTSFFAASKAVPLLQSKTADRFSNEI
jgi:hypothetical protein